MNYFKVLALVFGAAAALKPFYMHVLPWDEKAFIAKAYSEERPRWVVPVALAGLALVGYTWYVEVTTDVSYSLVITLLFSLTALKGAVLLFDYRRFHDWVAGMLRREGGRQIVLIDVAVGAFGLAVILLALLVY